MARKLPSFPMQGNASNADLQKLVRELEHQLSRKANVIDGRVYATDEQPLVVLDDAGTVLRLGRDVIPPMQPAGDYQPAGNYASGDGETKVILHPPPGWYDVAYLETARGFVDFYVWDRNGGQHGFAKVSVLTAYGKTSIVVANGVRFAAQSFADIRALYSTTDRVYGGCRIQIRVVYTPAELYVRRTGPADEFREQGWQLMEFFTPEIQSTAGWAQGAIISDITGVNGFTRVTDQ